MEFYWNNAIDEREALYDHMVDMAFNEDTPENEKIRDKIWPNELVIKYFDSEKYKSDIIDQGWMIIHSKKGFAIQKE